jgi:hypothetical protein
MNSFLTFGRATVIGFSGVGKPLCVGTGESAAQGYVAIGYVGEDEFRTTLRKVEELPRNVIALGARWFVFQP